jgi:hypothetical protein
MAVPQLALGSRGRHHMLPPHSSGEGGSRGITYFHRTTDLDFFVSVMETSCEYSDPDSTGEVAGFPSLINFYTSTLPSHYLPHSPLPNLPRLTRQTCLRGLGRETRLPQGESELGLWVSYLLPTTTRFLPLTRPRAPSLTYPRAPHLTLGLLPPHLLQRKSLLVQQIQGLFESVTKAFWPDSHLTVIS